MVEQLSPALVWVLVAVLVEAAIIDGWKLKVPNWLTYNLIGGGLIYGAIIGGWSGAMWSLGGAALGLALLLPLYAIGGMGAGDVKLLAGVGAWFGPGLTLTSFIVGGIVGGMIALAMMVFRGDVLEHLGRMGRISREIITVRDPAKLSESAAARKPNMMLLPYGIPLTIGTIGTLAWQGLLL